jgi:hypothetical protein
VDPRLFNAEQGISNSPNPTESPIPAAVKEIATRRALPNCHCIAHPIQDLSEADARIHVQKTLMTNRVDSSYADVGRGSRHLAGRTIGKGPRPFGWADIERDRGCVSHVGRVVHQARVFGVSLLAKNPKRILLDKRKKPAGQFRRG